MMNLYLQMVLTIFTNSDSTDIDEIENDNFEDDSESVILDDESDEISLADES